MKIIAKIDSHYTLELHPEELSDVALEKLVDAIRNGWPIADIAIEIIREHRSGEEKLKEDLETNESPSPERSRAWMPEEMLPPMPRTQPVKPDPS